MTEEKNRSAATASKISASMIESVQIRQLGAFNFEDHYDNLCALQDSAPLAAVKAHLSKGVLDLNGDRIRLTDWQPIINTIRINKSLEFIAVRSYHQVPPAEDEKRAAIIRRKLPAIRSKEITHRLMKALKDCLFVSPTLSCIELQGLALRERDLLVFVKGISKSQTLRHLSLESCRIGDKGLEILCKGLKNIKYINSVNLSGCSISPAGAGCLASVIKHQGMQRHNEAWQDSLRYRRPDLDRMSGIRRITANNNPMLGDDGVRLLAETLKDDLWLKALDLQACGIGTLGAKCFLDVLNYNTTLVVLDLRRNPLVETEVLTSVMEQLLLNNSGEDDEYTWMSVEEPEEQTVKQTRSKTRRRTTRVLNTSLGKKATIKSSNGQNSCSCCGGVTPTNSRHRARVSGVGTQRYEVPPSPGFPWRTAARANRFRGHAPETPRCLTDQSADVLTSESHGDDNNNMTATRSTKSSDVASRSRMKRITAETTAAMKKLEESHLSLDLSSQKDVMVELEQMRRRLKEERLNRARADQQVITLMIENRRLAEEVSLLRRTHKSNGGILEDDSFLESIESAFKQFHSFIDMLKEAGLGQLVAMAGLDQVQLPVIDGNINHSFPGSVESNNKSNSGSGAVRNGLPHSSPRASYTTAAYNTSPRASYTTAAYNTSLADVPLDSSEFLKDYQKPTRQISAESVSASSKEISHLTRAEGVHKQLSQTTVYDEESEFARKEADELYSRLVKETRLALGDYQEESSDRTTLLRPGSMDSERHMTGQCEERTHFRSSSGDSIQDAKSKQASPGGDSRLNDAGGNSDKEKKNGLKDTRDVDSLLGVDDNGEDDF